MAKQEAQRGTTTDPAAELVSLLENATQEQLDGVKARIAEHERKLSALRVLQRAIEQRLGLAEPPARRGRARRDNTDAKPSKKPTLAELIFDVLSTHGPGTIKDITRKLAASGMQVTEHGVHLSIRKSHWFDFDAETERFMIAHTTGRD